MEGSHPDSAETTAWDDARELARLGKSVFGVPAETFPPESPAFVNQLAALGFNLLLQKKHAEAEAVFRDCLTIRDMKAPDAWPTFEIKSLLGAALLGDVAGIASDIAQEGGAELGYQRTPLHAVYSLTRFWRIASAGWGMRRVI